jgi:hypothetical protein
VGAGEGEEGTGGRKKKGGGAHHSRGEGDVDGRRRGRVRSSGRAGEEGCAGEGRMRVVGEDWRRKKRGLGGEAGEWAPPEGEAAAA